MRIEEYTKKGENLEMVPQLLDNVIKKVSNLIEAFDHDFK